MEWFSSQALASAVQARDGSDYGAAVTLDAGREVLYMKSWLPTIASGGRIEASE